MAIPLLRLMTSVRFRLDDCGGDVADETAWVNDDARCLWKNTELVELLRRALLDVGQRVPWTDEGAAADTVGLPTRLAVVAGNPEVALPDAILMVEQVRLLSSGLLLEKTESGRLTSARNDATWTTLTGTPTHYVEPRRGLLRLYPIPTAADELRLRVQRRSFAAPLWRDVLRVPTTALDDVPDDLEEALIIATCRLAYLKHDAETYNLPMAQDFERQLTDLVGPPVSWRHREARRENANLGYSLRGASSIRNWNRDDSDMRAW